MAERDLLRAIGIFSTLSDPELDIIGTNCEFRDYADGETVYEAGTTDEELFVIERGSVRIVRTADGSGGDGGQIDLARFVAGEGFGEQDLMSAEPRSARAIVDGDTRLLAFPAAGRRLGDVIHEHPAIFAKVLHQLLVLVAGRIRSTNKLVSENSAWVDQLRNQVFGDKLTGLYSKGYLTDELPGFLRGCGDGAAFIMVKPDNFKVINDSFGHDAGDHALRILADRLKSVLPDGSVAIRYLGNENGVVVPGADQTQATEIARTIHRILTSTDLSEVDTDAGPETVSRAVLSFSIGIALYPRDASTADELAECAHTSLFAARDAGGCRIHCTGAGVVMTPEGDGGRNDCGDGAIDE